MVWLRRFPSTATFTRFFRRFTAKSVAEACCIAQVWLRSGNTGAARGATAFLAEVRALLPSHLALTRVRADSGFFDEAFLLALVAAQAPYIVAARFTNPLQAAVYRLTFRPFAPGLEVAELPYQALRWTTAFGRLTARWGLRPQPKTTSGGFESHTFARCAACWSVECVAPGPPPSEVSRAPSSIATGS